MCGIDGRLEIPKLVPMDVFAALSNPIRRDILALLRDGDRSAGDIAAHFKQSKPTLSGHFSALREAGLIVAERRGTQIMYSVNLSLLEAALLGLMRRVSRSNQGTETTSGHSAS
jgi:DNA-binding transcriptional ArsR family regulator